MSLSDLEVHLNRVDSIVTKINNFVPENKIGTTEFRADLAGLLVVAMVASYESCVKEVLWQYASTKHSDFATFTNNNFDKLNSKIAINDLHKYAKLFNNAINENFKKILNERKEQILKDSKKDIKCEYQQILKWRHDFAHAGKHNTTINEAITFHNHGKEVLFCFARAFNVLSDKA